MKKNISYAEHCKVVVENYHSAKERRFQKLDYLMSNSIGHNEHVILEFLLKQYFYFKKTKQLQNDESFYSTVDDMSFYTGGFTERQQRSSITKLKQMGFITTKLKGVPAKRHFVINMEKYFELIEFVKEHYVLEETNLTKKELQNLLQKNKFRSDIMQDLDPEKSEISYNKENKERDVNAFLSEKGNFDSLRSSSFPMSPEESSLQETIVVHPLLKGNKKKRTKLALSPPSASTIKESVDSKKKLVGLKKKQDKDKPLPKSLDQAAPVTKVVSTPGIPKIKNGNKIDRSKFKPGVVEIEKKLEDPIALYGKYWNWAKDVLDLWISLSKGHALPTPSTKYHPVYRKTIAHELKLGASQSVLETAIRNYHKALEDPGTIFGAKTVTKSNVLKELTRMNPTKFFKCLCDDRKRELEKITTVNLKPLLLHKKPYRLFLGDYKKDVLTKILYITKVKTKHKELVQKAIEVFDRLNPGIEVPGYKIDQTIKYALEYWNSLLQNKTFVITDRFLSEKIWDANNRHLFDNNLLGVENAIGDPNDMSGPLYLLDLARATAEDRPALIEKIHAKFFFDSCVFDYMRKNDMINFDF